MPDDDRFHRTRTHQGHFGVAVDSLGPGAWHALGDGEGSDLWRCSGEDEVYRGSLACQEEGVGFFATVVKGPDIVDELILS